MSFSFQHSLTLILTHFPHRHPSSLFHVQEVLRVPSSVYKKCSMSLKTEWPRALVKTPVKIWRTKFSPILIQHGTCVRVNVSSQCSWIEENTDSWRASRLDLSLGVLDKSLSLGLSGKTHCLCVWYHWLAGAQMNQNSKGKMNYCFLFRSSIPCLGHQNSRFLRIWTLGPTSSQFFARSKNCTKCFTGSEAFRPVRSHDTSFPAPLDCRQLGCGLRSCHTQVRQRPRGFLFLSFWFCPPSQELWPWREDWAQNLERYVCSTHTY